MKSGDIESLLSPSKEEISPLQSPSLQIPSFFNHKSLTPPSHSSNAPVNPFAVKGIRSADLGQRKGNESRYVYEESSGEESRVPKEGVTWNELSSSKSTKKDFDPSSVRRIQSSDTYRVSQIVEKSSPPNVLLICTSPNSSHVNPLQMEFLISNLKAFKESEMKFVESLEKLLQVS